jgi:hypothetical protein
MLELGNVAITLSGGQALNPRQRVTSESAKLTSSTAIPADEAAVAVIRDLLSTQKVQQDGSNADAQPSPDQSIKEIAAAIREKLKEFEQIIEAITTGRFSAQSLSDNLEAQAEQIRHNETSASRVYSDVSELLSHFREEVNQIRSFDGFLIGVHEKIEQFSNQAEFKLKQVGDVGEHIIDVNEKLELGIFTLSRVREHALKVLRGQDALEPQRVLALLEDNAHVPSTAEPTRDEIPPPRQDVLL